MDAGMGLELNDLLRKEGVDPDGVLVLRHRPKEPELRKVLPWLAKDRPDVFAAVVALETCWKDTLHRRGYQRNEPSG